MEKLTRKIVWDGVCDVDALVEREWLVTNGLGGYAAGTLAGVLTRRYHGYLIAALPAPLGRVVMFNHVAERLRLLAPDTGFLEPEATVISGELKESEVPHSGVGNFLTEFRLENGLPIWRFQVGEFVREKILMMPHMQNSVFVTYHLLSGPGAVQLEIRPSFHFRPHEAPVSERFANPYTLSVTGRQFRIFGGTQLPPVRMLVEAERHYFVMDDAVRQTQYRVEADRGYDSVGRLWSPGYFCLVLHPGRKVSLTASTETWSRMRAIRPADAWTGEQTRRTQLMAMAAKPAQTGFGAELVLAADQFIIAPVGRTEDTVRARAWGDEVRTVIAGYHWFTDWGRDTMISLEGLSLTTGRIIEARWILRTFGHYIQQGLIPNRFPEHVNEAVYNTADATLWYFHAIDRYLEASGDRVTLRLLLPRLVEIIEHHCAGTLFGIGVDPEDGLLRQGEQGYQLTWMDAKVGDWAVTPRRGKAVEINALWYNALCLLTKWLQEEAAGIVDWGSTGLGHTPPDPARYAAWADKVRASFNRRFWYEKGGYLYDVIDGEEGDDPALRPNQVLAISLPMPMPVLDPEHWEPVLRVVTETLLTPVGLRSLTPGDPDYRSRYFGDLRARDAAYHQGTVWTWLIGPYIDAWLKLHPGEKQAARGFLAAFEPRFSEWCIGAINEVFDAEEPFHPRGCIAQAWSVAEVLRCLVKTAE
ncbi:MAG: glycogen debranching protein [Planctomycetes bacterium]|nr:glycogen debranching protein [Planctomycetota bacterium]